MSGNLHYQQLLSERYPNVECAIKAIVDMSAELRLPKGTEYFFSDLHGEHTAFINLLRSASGVVRDKIDTVYGDILTQEECNEIADLIAHPHHYLQVKRKKTRDYSTWSAITINRLVQIAREIASKYSMDRVAGTFNPAYADILEPLITMDNRISNKAQYYREIIDSAISCGIGDTLIISLCKVIQQVAVDHLHIIGDIFDRGPRPDLIMDELMRLRSVDIQWGNHDVDWIGAVAGNQVCMFSVLRKAISYNNFDCLEDGYGLNLRPLSSYAARIYEGDPCTAFKPHLLDFNQYDPVDVSLAAKMHKEAAIIMFKLEGQLIARNPQFEMDDRRLLHRMDLTRGVVNIGGEEYKLTDTNFPTIDPADPYALTREEQDIVDTISASFQHSERLRRHIDFIVTHGSMYKNYNGNLLFHGCIPSNEDGSFMEVRVGSSYYHGKALMDVLDNKVRRGYYSGRTADTDLFWYMWIGAKSPLFGKDKVTTFERYFTKEPHLREEPKNPYYSLINDKAFVEKILMEFGLDPAVCHVMNGHMPVKKGENPIKADGRLFVIDGGIAKSYHPTTGIAGYTLIFNSTVIKLAEHRPVIDSHGVQTGTHTITRVVEKLPHQFMMDETDLGKAYKERIENLKKLIKLYRNGTLNPTINSLDDSNDILI